MRAKAKLRSSLAKAGKAAQSKEKQGLAEFCQSLLGVAEVGHGLAEQREAKVWSCNARSGKAKVRRGAAARCVAQQR